MRIWDSGTAGFSDLDLGQARLVLLSLPSVHTDAELPRFLEATDFLFCAADAGLGHGREFSLDPALRLIPAKRAWQMLFGQTFFP